MDSGEMGEMGELGYGGELSRELYGENLGLFIGLELEISLFQKPFSELFTGILYTGLRFMGTGVDIKSTRDDEGATVESPSSDPRYRVDILIGQRSATE